MSTVAPAVSPMEWGSAPELVGPRHQYRIRRLAEVLEEGLPHGHVLDAGCGAGNLTLLLAQRGYRVTAVDGSRAFVEHLRRRAADAGLADRIAVDVIDLQEPDLPPGLFDGIVCGEVLEHLPDDRRAVEGLVRALRTGGVFALTVPAGAERYDWVDAWAGHHRRYEEADLQKLLEGAGLRVERLARWGFPVMAWYEQHVQKPGFSRVARPGGDTTLIARLARSKLTTAALGAAFSVDRLFDGHPRGTGLIARARKP